MTLDEFASDFLENINLSVENEENEFEDAITKDILEYIIDCGEVLEPQLCKFKGKGIKLNAFDYDDENEAVDLFVTIAKTDKRIQKISDKDILDTFNKAEKFYAFAINENLEVTDEQNFEELKDAVDIIKLTKKDVKTVRIFVLTNGICSANLAPKDKDANGIIWDYELWDIERVYQQYLIKAGKQKIEIDFEIDYNFKLKCLQMPNVSEKVDEYLAILPALILADIYGKYKQGLLEKNVRTFLQFKAKVNNGIRETIRSQPDMFFAYNNGISTTAESVDVSYDDDGLSFLNRIENLQIVNGGQTTASIYFTSREKGIDLSKVYVPMKISVIKPGNSLNEIVPNISRFANSQTAIKASDFSSNSPYHISLERWSRSEWVPASSGGKATSKWYYERTRGQYLDERSRFSSSKDQKNFDLEFSKKQKFSKTDLAKFEMCWKQRPHDASKGGEKNYLLFLKEIDQNSEITKNEYQQLIAKAILFQEIDKMVSKKKLGGYKANVVCYTVSLVSDKTKQRLNLNDIWQNQSLNEELVQFLDNLIYLVWQHINEPSKPGMNITEWCKRAECWNKLKEHHIDILPIESKLESNLIPNSTLNEREILSIEQASLITSEQWFALSKWLKDNNEATPFDRKIVYNFGVSVRRKTQLSLKQSQIGLRIFKDASNKGFV